MFNILNSTRSFINWVFPVACVCCNKVSDCGVLCAKCFNKITFIDIPYCGKCGKSFSTDISHKTLCTECFNETRRFDIARSLFVYNLYARQIIVRIKQTGDRNLIQKCCYLLLIRYATLFKNIDAIVPVPSHWTRTLVRGFNPADVIAWELSLLTSIPVIRKLKRISRTKYQHKISKAERAENVKGAFMWYGEIPSNILLVDDVFTTGSTLNECSKTLRDAGTEKIHCVTLASTDAR